MAKMGKRAADWTAISVTLLEHAKRLREWRSSAVKWAYACYGDGGSLISGIERNHFPERVKDDLRANARAIANTLDAAYSCWKWSRRRADTFRALARQYRVEGVRY